MPRIVAVAGGGIAGCATVLALARAGLPVAWIAPEAAQGDRPGESLGPAAGPLLTRLGLGDLLQGPRHRPAAVSFTCWGSAALLERSSAAVPGGVGHVVDRPLLEAALARHAGECAQVRRIRDALAGFRRDTGGWSLETAAGEALQAAFLVDATGRAAAIGRRLSVLRRGDSLVAACAFLQQQDPEVEPTPATLVEAVADGWWYATLLPDGRLAINYYSDPDLMPNGLGRDLAAWRGLVAESRYVSRWIDSAGFAVTAPPLLASAGTSWLDRAAGPDWIAVGDAAAAFDPLSAHGMTTALWTGIEGAKAVALALDAAPEALDRYAGRVARGMASYRADRARIYGHERRFADRPFWRRRHGSPVGPAGTGPGADR